MKKYDVIIIGSGCGMNIVDEALGSWYECRSGG
jgi:hypothetical protein